MKYYDIKDRTINNLILPSKYGRLTSQENLQNGNSLLILSSGKLGKKKFTNLKPN